MESFLGPYFGTHLIQSKFRESRDRGHEQVYPLGQAYNEEPPLKTLINLCNAHLSQAQDIILVRCYGSYLIGTLPLRRGTPAHDHDLNFPGIFPMQ